MWKLVLAAGLVPALGAQTFSGSADLDAAVEDAIARGQIPGAVVVVGSRGSIVHRKAYGARALVPAREPMTVDTIFDCASLTKVVATSAAIMKLFEQGKIRLNDPVTQYLPEFQNGKSAISVRDLLTHFSGLRPDVDLKPEWSGYETGVRLALTDKPRYRPGQRFIYSDINFVLLGEIVRRVSGMPLPEFVRQTVWDPLGMRDTMFQPPPEWKDRIAPTEQTPRNGPPLRGVVHDPTARFMGGVAGHAGMFSTADDLARFAQMMLNGGEWQGRRLFSAAVVEKFTTPQSPAGQPVLRGLGWDIDSAFSGARGDLFPVGSYGHTGFTGTSLWLDPHSSAFVVLLTNAVHPVYRGGPITSLRGRVATVVAAALGVTGPGITLTGYNETVLGPGVRRVVARDGDVRTGLDVWVRNRFAPLQGRRVGLITNHTGIDRQGRRNLDLMRDAGVHVAALFSPEHGFFGAADEENIRDTRDPQTGIRVFSLYAGENRRPSAEMLRGLDALVFDIQDIGARFYTYLSTLAYCLEEAARHRIPFYVLDRPNPITGVHVEGPMLDPDLVSFVGCYPLPVRHGMTLGELARLLNGEQRWGARLEVVPLEGWERGDWFDSTGLPWIPPSPNMRTLTAATLYPGVALLESSPNYSVGRGADSPFEMAGAEFIDGPALARYLNARRIPGVRFYPARFRPEASRFAGKWISGIRILLTAREELDSVQLGLEIAAAILKLYPGKLDLETNARLIGSRKTMAALRAGADPGAIVQEWEEPLRGFLQVREKYLLYR
jgi:uncharacterized protein YbbC (DUF1343 family)/CubicO group peptidase (beta-lactamase class C family)